MNVAIQATMVGRPQLAAVIAALEGAGKIELNEAMGHEVQRVTVDYVTMIAQTRHLTADDLGAKPTGHWAQAAEKIEATILEVDAAGASLTLNHPGFGRAFHDVTIVPREAKALAIPINAISYGRRAAEMWDQYHLFILGWSKRQHGLGEVTAARGDGSAVIAMKMDGEIIPLFALVKSTFQKQDRTLLPSDQVWEEAATRAAVDYVTAAMGGVGA